MHIYVKKIPQICVYASVYRQTLIYLHYFILFDEIKCLMKLNVIFFIIIYNMCIHIHMKFDIPLGTQHVNG